jgi:O-antigen ligase
MSSPSSLVKVGFKYVRSDTYIAKFIGFLLGLPISFPAPPMYFLGFLALFLGGVSYRKNFSTSHRVRDALAIILIVLALVSNFFGVFQRNIEDVRIVTTSLFFILFLFSHCISDKRALLVGFCSAMMMWAVFIITVAGLMRVFDHGVALFVLPELRLWGADIFPDWPNYMAFMLALAFMLNASLFGRPVQAIFLIVAALITTSRTPLIAVCLLAFSFVVQYLRYNRTTVVVYVTVTIGIIIIAVLSMIGVVEIDQNFIDRMLVFEDREEIYNFSLELIRESPLIGQGSILLDESVGFTGQPSFHNSYLDVAVRHGLPALIVFLLLLTPPRGAIKVGGIYFAATVAFFLIGSFFQNFLKHPHLLMLYVCIINASDLFRAKQYPY